MSNAFRLPSISHRTAVIGRTGSGKTVLGAWLLSLAPFHKMPYVMIDYKGDELLNSIDRVAQISLNEVPRHPGLYLLPVNPDDNPQVEQWLRKVWAQENIGLYVDETYMLPDKGGFQGILTQGRSKHIPVIALTQRPKWLSRFVFSEADFFAVFHLNDRDDRVTVKRFFHQDIDLNNQIPDYHSHWYDVGKNHYSFLKPVPEPDDIAERISDRLKPNVRVI